MNVDVREHDNSVRRYRDFIPRKSDRESLQEAFYGDPKAQALLREGGKLATWQTYVAQTLDL